MASAGHRTAGRTDAANGALSGTVAGLASGTLLAACDMLPTLAMTIGSRSAVVGGFVHLAVAAALGALFAVYLRPATHLRDLITAGILYGVAWWLVIPLLLIPAWVSQNTSLVVVQFAVMSLAGQALYGPIAGAVVYTLRKRQSRTTLS